MRDDLFRFVNIRPPQRRDSPERTVDYIDPYGRYDPPISGYCDFLYELREALENGGRAQARTVADTFVTDGQIVSSLKNLSTPLAEFDQAAAGLGPDADVATVSGMVRQVYGSKPDVTLKWEPYWIARRNLADSITAAFFSSLPMPRLYHLTRGIRLCELIARLANADPDISAEGGVNRVLRATVLIPIEDEFVEPEMSSSFTISQPPPQPQSLDTNGHSPTTLSAELKSAVPTAGYVAQEVALDVEGQEAFQATPLYRLYYPSTGDHWYTTNPAYRYDLVKRQRWADEGIACYVYSRQAPGTSPLYQLMSSEIDKIDYFYTTSSTERDSYLAAGRYADAGIVCYVYDQQVPGTTPLYRLYGAPRMARDEGDWLYTTSSTERDNAIETSGYSPRGISCYVISIPITAGAIKVAGVSDLLIVRQTLRGYDRGEIAHVENALKGEYKERTYRRTQATETQLLQETETTTESERDLQSTERFELKNETNKTIQEDTQAQAGITVTANYGTVAGNLSTTAMGQFAFERSVEEATQTATSYARDIVDRSRTRVEERELERRSTRTLVEVEETAKHGLNNNKAGADHIVGIYRWVDKIYEAQIVNYGRRLMLEFYVPEPAAYHRAMEASERLRGLTRERPEPPKMKKDGSIVDLQPQYVEWPGVQELANKYQASGIEPPPSEQAIVGYSLEVPFTDKDYDKDAPMGMNTFLPGLGATKVGTEVKIPTGYVAKKVSWSGQVRPYVRKDPTKDKSSWYWEDTTDVSVGSFTLRGISGTIEDVTLNITAPKPKGFTDTLPVAVITSSAGVVVTFRILCDRTIELYQEWQVKTYDVIMAAYRDQLQRYEEEVARLDVERGVQISGRPPAENRKIEQTELKRATISILTSQHFDAFGAVDDAQSQDRSKSPNIDFDKATVEGNLVQYFEQVFEWHNMTYLFYPYFWGRKSGWPDVLSQASTDPLFAQFLRAGYAMVQVPVRLNYENMVLFYLTSSKIWQETTDTPVVKPYLPLVDEIRNQTGDDFVIGKGTVGVKKGQIEVTGNGTRFRKHDVDREIRLKGKVYRVSSVQSATEITLAKPFTSDNDAVNEAYSLGPKLVGPSWEVRLPTTLVMIDKADVVLPTWSDN